MARTSVKGKVIGAGKGLILKMGEHGLFAGNDRVDLIGNHFIAYILKELELTQVMELTNPDKPAKIEIIFHT